MGWGAGSSKGGAFPVGNDSATDFADFSDETRFRTQRSMGSIRVIGEIGG
jgi:hypothetical protein